MKFRPTAVGYVRSDISGAGQAWDEEQIRSLARRLGYDFAKMVVVDGRSGKSPLAVLKATVTRLAAEAVVVPTADHFDSEAALTDLVKAADVITVNPENTYARWVIPPMPSGA
ncbi:hypothetical protein ACFXHA_17940 [Nocardia sp. NPDC059240]|uniref:hypothetical protein n=1 Tax=Nocardia sp. NPDC059240 TaxID=3346786 RepID=UPI0036A483B3